MKINQSCPVPFSVPAAVSFGTDKIILPRTCEALADANAKGYHSGHQPRGTVQRLEESEVRRTARLGRSDHMCESYQDVEEMARATSDKHLDAVRRILTRKPNLSHCLYGYSLSGGDDDFTILKMLLSAGADINDRSFGDPLLHGLLDVIADSQGGHGEQIDWSQVGQVIEFGADPLLRDGKGRNLLDIAGLWSQRASLDAYLRSRGIRLE